MGEVNRAAKEIRAKIVYFGSSDAGMTANLETIHRKLKKQHRGELRVMRVPKDRKAAYEVLPVDLGEVRGFSTAIQIYSVPGAPKHKEIRGHILDEDVDGIVFVADLRPERHDATVAALKELQVLLKRNGRRLDDMPLVVQYNRRDLVDESALDALHRRLGLKPAAYFEAVASEGTGVLQTLTTLSKVTLSEIRNQPDSKPQAASTARAAARDPASLDKGFQVESAGPAHGSGNEVEVPITLIDEATGRRVEFSLRLTVGKPQE